MKKATYLGFFLILLLGCTTTKQARAWLISNGTMDKYQVTENYKNFYDRMRYWLQDNVASNGDLLLGGGGTHIISRIYPESKSGFLEVCEELSADSPVIRIEFKASSDTSTALTYYYAQQMGFGDDGDIRAEMLRYRVPG